MRPANRRTRRVLLAFGALLSSAATAGAQGAPVADVHFHHLGPAATASSLRAMDSMGVRFAVVIGTPAQLADVAAPAGLLLARALTLPCFGGRMPNSGVACYADGGEWPSLDSVRAMAASGRLQMLGEINTQYGGLRVDDPRLEPYLALAEELDLPVGFHLGIGPPGVAYADTPNPPSKSPLYRGAAGDPLVLESILLKHPKLRAYVMHAAWPMRDAMLYMLYMHPKLYVDVAVLQFAIPRVAYESYLRDLISAGFAARIMFGSDGSARRVQEGIAAIREATFLTADQQNAILYANAAKFFRLSPP